MLRRKHIMAASLKGDNDARCFNASSNDQKGSSHNKRAKRLASKRARRLLKEELNDVLST